MAQNVFTTVVHFEAQERFDLRHKGMNKWAQRQKKRDFVDDFTKKQLEEQHRLGQVPFAFFGK